MWDCIECLTKRIAASLPHCPKCKHGRHEKGTRPEALSGPVPPAPESAADDKPEVPASAPRPAPLPLPADPKEA